MRVTQSATKRGFTERDILHALDHYVRVFTEQGDAELAMFIGPARDGTMLEVGVIEDDDPRAIHAMQARSKYWPSPEVMTMTTKHRLSDADALARFEEGIDPDSATVRDRGATADIRAAVRMRDTGQQMVDDAVVRARHGGLTWIEIGVALGVSPQAARKKYLNRV